MGDSGLFCEGLGDADLRTRAGDAGRAIRDTAETDGLAGLGILAAKRAILGAGTTVGSDWPWELGPGTRRSLSSSCVLSFADKVPTRAQTFSPTRV